jgi:hypothetical protein
MRTYTGKPSPQKLLEREIQKQVKDFLRWRGWRIVRHQVTVASTGASTFSVGEKGMADLQAIYYIAGNRPGLTLTLWVETKRLGKKLRPEQEVWKHTDDRVKGQKAMLFEELSIDLRPLSNSPAEARSPR